MTAASRLPSPDASAAEVETSAASRLLSIAASAAGRQPQASGTGSYPWAHFGEHLLDLQPAPARTVMREPIAKRVARTSTAGCNRCSAIGVDIMPRAPAIPVSFLRKTDHRCHEGGGGTRIG